MESPGEYLKREREHRGVSLLKIFETTRVPMKYLEAIEADRVDGLPHPTFTKGYIRSYCKVLGLDENDAVLRFDVWLSEKTAETQEAGKPKPIQELKRAKTAPPKPRREIKIPANVGKALIVSAGVIVVIVAYALTKRDLSAPEPALTPAPVPIQTAAEPSPSIEAPPAPSATAPQTPVAAVPPVKALQPVVQPAPAAVPPPAPAAAKPAAQPVMKSVQQAEPQKAEKALQPEPVKKEAQANVAINEPAKNHTLTASARAMVWLKVGIDKEEPKEVLLKQGERVTWTAADNINIVIGNAGGVSLTYNGKAMPGLGENGEVIDLRLPSGKSYKVKKTQPAAEPKPAIEPQHGEPVMQPAVNMPEVPARMPSGQP